MVASIFCSAMISAAPRSRNPRGSLALGRVGFCEAMMESFENGGVVPAPRHGGKELPWRGIKYYISRPYKRPALPLASPHVAMRTSPDGRGAEKLSSKVYPDATTALKGVT